jgi:L-ascorbate metabolism protein UlaG (beta-lactamase superfamily)
MAETKLKENEIKIEWFGHACFKVSTNKVSIVIDPFDHSVGYKVPDLTADVLLMSHDHFDHSYAKAVRAKDSFKGNALPGGKNITGGNIKSISTWHDTSRGSQRGANAIWRIELEGTVLAHLGDLGHILDRTQLDLLGKVNILFIPVGGVYTITSNEANRIVETIKPNIAVPMHYSPLEVRISLGLDRVDSLLNDKKDVSRLDTNNIVIRKDDFPKPTRILVFKYVR